MDTHTSKHTEGAHRTPYVPESAVVLGGGPDGLTAAWALAAHGVKVSVFNRAAISPHARATLSPDAPPFGGGPHGRSRRRCRSSDVGSWPCGERGSRAGSRTACDSISGRFGGRCHRLIVLRLPRLTAPSSPQTRASCHQDPATTPPQSPGKHQPCICRAPSPGRGPGARTSPGPGSASAQWRRRALRFRGRAGDISCGPRGLRLGMIF